MDRTTLDLWVGIFVAAGVAALIGLAMKVGNLTSNQIGETYAVTYNPAQRWYYFPRMMPDETVLIRCFDSARFGAARFSAHGAFDDPNTPEDAPPRESIETRALVFFAD